MKNKKNNPYIEAKKNHLQFTSQQQKPALKTQSNFLIFLLFILKKIISLHVMFWSLYLSDGYILWAMGIYKYNIYKSSNLFLSCFIAKTKPTFDLIIMQKFLLHLQKLENKWNFQFDVLQDIMDISCEYIKLKKNHLSVYIYKA